MNLRATQSTKGEILCTVPYGKGVQVINMLLGSDWVHCRYNGYEGYMMRSFLRMGDAIYGSGLGQTSK